MYLLQPHNLYARSCDGGGQIMGRGQLHWGDNKENNCTSRCAPSSIHTTLLLLLTTVQYTTQHNTYLHTGLPPFYELKLRPATPSRNFSKFRDREKMMTVTSSRCRPSCSWMMSVTDSRREKFAEPEGWASSGYSANE